LLRTLLALFATLVVSQEVVTVDWYGVTW